MQYGLCGCTIPVRSASSKAPILPEHVSIATKPTSAAAPAVNNFAETTAELVKNLPLANDGRAAAKYSPYGQS